MLRVFRRQSSKRRKECDKLRHCTQRKRLLAVFNSPWRHAARHPSPEIQRVGVAAIDISGIVDRDRFKAVDLDRFQNERRDLTVLDAANPDAQLVRRIAFVRRVVRHVENVVLVNEQPARAAELFPLQEIFSVLVERLDAVAREELWPDYKQMRDRIGAERGWPPMGRAEFDHEADRGSLYVGSPETVARRIAATSRALGISRFDMKYSAGHLSHDRLMRSIELYGSKVVIDLVEIHGTR